MLSPKLTGMADVFVVPERIPTLAKGWLGWATRAPGPPAPETRRMVEPAAPRPRHERSRRSLPPLRQAHRNKYVVELQNWYTVWHAWQPGLSVRNCLAESSDVIAPTERISCASQNTFDSLEGGPGDPSHNLAGGQQSGLGKRNRAAYVQPDWRGSFSVRRTDCRFRRESLRHYLLRRRLQRRDGV